jgi:hypothetical protein
MAAKPHCTPSTRPGTSPDTTSTFRVSLPVGVLDAFDKWRNKRNRPAMFGACLLRLVELDGERVRNAFDTWWRWRSKLQANQLDVRPTSFRIPTTLAEMYSEFAARIGDATIGARGKWVGAAILDAIQAPCGQWPGSVKRTFSNGQAELYRYHQWETRLDDDFVEAIRNIWQAAGEEPPEMDLKGRPPVEPDAGGLARYRHNGGCLTDEEAFRRPPYFTSEYMLGLSSLHGERIHPESEYRFHVMEGQTIKGTYAAVKISKKRKLVVIARGADYQVVNNELRVAWIDLGLSVHSDAA